MPARGLALRRLTAAVVATVVCLAAAGASAQSGKGDYVGGWSVAGGIGYAIPNTDEFANELAWRFGVGYSRDPRFEVNLEVGGFSTDVTQPEADGLPTHDLASGRLDVLPVCLTMQYRAALPEGMTTVILLAGVGYYLVEYTMADAPRGVFVAGGGLPDQSVRDTWGFHVGTGLEYALSGWLSLFVDGRYLFIAPQVSGTASGGGSLGGSLDLNTWLFTGGIKVAF